MSRLKNSPGKFLQLANMLDVVSEVDYQGLPLLLEGISSFLFVGRISRFLHLIVFSLLKPLAVRSA
jgi:hypothetical protein